MLKKRVVPVLLLHDGRMVKGKQFKDFRDTGRANSAVRIYSSQDTDELIFLDISANQISSDQASDLVAVIKSASEECFMPLTAGGGIDSVDKIRQLIQAGADKVVINTAAVEKPEIIKEAAAQFGSQCIVAGVDYRRDSTGADFVWVRSGTVKTDLHPLEHAKDLAARGAGEIFLNSIDRDGMMCGYDLELARKIADSVPVPVILCGGAGTFAHLSEALEQTDVSAVACASLFHFGDNSPIRARSYLRNRGIPMRTLK